MVVVTAMTLAAAVLTTVKRHGVEKAVLPLSKER